MSYAAQANRPNPAAALGAMGVPAAFGAILIVGLAVTVTNRNDSNPEAWQYKEPDVTVPLDPPEPVETPSTTTTTEQVTEPREVITRPDSTMDWEMGPTAPVGTLTDPGEDLLGTLGPVEVTVPQPRPTPRFDPVAAAPRGNPGRWITNDDYRTSWINRGYSGVAAFSLEIDTRGKVSNCTITRSTGHDALDDATCRLLANRAQFNPAKDSSGNVVPGTYRSSVAWEIPN